MNHTFEELSEKLAIYEIRPTFQRFKILDYLIKNPCHPTVDRIYKELHREIPTLSKTTIYNTLNLFQKTGLVRALMIEDNETRYDIITEIHGHFKCDICGFISNFGLNIDTIETGELTGYKISDKSVYFKGVCPKCLVNINSDHRKE